MSFDIIIWVDEAWRGAWAGPVVAGAFLVSFDFDFALLAWLTDSKKLTREKRETLFEKIISLEKLGKCVTWVGISSHEVIDHLGIREANRLAMAEAIRQIREKTPFIQKSYEIRIDGRDNYLFDAIPKENIRYIVRGDLTEKAISAASIIAKVTRDHMMCEYSEKFSLYHFDLHKGYGTSKHQSAMLYHGISPIHRKSYAPVKALISKET